MKCLERPIVFDLANHELGGSQATDAAHHLLECLSCRAEYDAFRKIRESFPKEFSVPRTGTCLTEQQIIRYLQRTLPSESRATAERHLACCADCLEDLLIAADESDPLSFSIPSDRMVHRIVSLPSRSSTLRLRRTARLNVLRHAHSRAPILPVAIASAAALFLALLVYSRMSSSSKNSMMTATDNIESKASSSHLSPPEKDPSTLTQAPHPQEPSMDHRVREPHTTPLENPEKGTLLQPSTENPPSKKDRTEHPTVVASAAPPLGPWALRGNLLIRHPSEKDFSPFTDGTPVASEDVLATSHRDRALLALDGGVRLLMTPQTHVRLESKEDALRVFVDHGETYYSVEKRRKPLVVSTPYGEASVLGTSFVIKVNPERTFTELNVVEGVVKLKTPKGEVSVGSNFRSVARAGNTPSKPERMDTTTIVTWMRREGLMGQPARETFLDIVKGLKPKLSGLVVSIPYATTETRSIRLGRRLAAELDAGLVLGRYTRDRDSLKIWLNIDRGTESRLDERGRLGPVETTERSKKWHEAWIRSLREAAGVESRRSIPFIVSIRESSDAAWPEVLDIAAHGISRKGLQNLKKTYDSILERYGPATKLTIGLEGLDPDYTYRATSRSFGLTEDEAKNSLEHRHARKTMTMFLPLALGGGSDDYETYAKILAEFLETAHAVK